jgi:hypothetical protein
LGNRIERRGKHGQNMQRLPMLRQERHAPASALKTIRITSPFAVWGLDMVGPFKTA